jgi:hypothetical protein
VAATLALQSAMAGNLGFTTVPVLRLDDWQLVVERIAVP